MKRLLLAILVVILLVGAPIGIAKDQFPNGCVDCHIQQHRLTLLLGQWNGKVDAKRLAAMQAFVPKGVTLKGRHPTVAGKDIPASCMKCHAAASKTIPPLAPLMHGIHLAKGDAGDFVKQFGGECTHCHKLNKANGTWSMPSGAEK